MLKWNATNAKIIQRIISFIFVSFLKLNKYLKIKYALIALMF